MEYPYQQATDASPEQVRAYGLEPESGVRYLMMKCGCDNDALIEIRGGQGEVRSYESKCPFCHGSLSFKTEFADVDFHFDY